ncbi:helix-turn-helix domain-containing protein [Rhizobium sp. SSA_523]|uniref:helix-turn-helix domain-containing protein n=1 Tax=Rhizobium sp. SSA_523 TaxID=2952477 RepID=UPI00208FFB72|nr:helix-turn-helix domain-containing protein [Rhizobium sp. SSA_523]MCO5730684.1 helix-turn-helix domain-containing protein [Rhizobium sp. SSA_523]WKC24488.1 helix-turn-helix domain-containing protein [Rhizobium sp. SSA_523]
MISKEQIRAARAMLNLSPEALSAEAGLSHHDYLAIETGQQPGDLASLEMLRAVFERHGVVFLASGEDDPGAGPGLRLRTGPSEEGIRPENLSSANDG